MKKYLSIIANQINITLAYKFSLVSAFMLPLFQVFISIFVWKVIYSNNPMDINYTLNEMVTYIITSTFISVVYSVSHAFRLTKLVRTGNLSFILIRPYNYLLESFSFFTGKKVVEGIILFLIFFTLSAAGIIEIGGINLISVLLLISTYIMVFLFINLIGILSFWLIQMWTIKPLFVALVGLLGGTYFPLDILPSSVYKILKYNPFSFIGFVNTKTLLGKFSVEETFVFLTVSICWSFVFIILTKLLWKKGLRIYEGMGV